ncbi:MAG: DUF4097 family beta strand repeat-containing protein [Oscillospiraceae bacterium]|nr:DUF4097 family beta strand repeat-containing protein [Oscillospiraceae bacterium]
MKYNNKVIITVFSILMTLGVICVIGAFISTNFNFKFLNTDKEYTEIIKDFDVSEGCSLQIITDIEDIRIGISEDNLVHLKYYDSDNQTHSFEYTEDIVSLHLNRVYRKWYDYIRFNFYYKNNCINVLIPDKMNGDITLKAATGTITVSNISSDGNIMIKNSTGEINIENLHAVEINMNSATGSIMAQKIVSSKFNAECSIGNIDTKNIIVDSFTAISSTGNVSLNSVSSDSVKVKCSTGNVVFTDLDGKDIDFKTSTGKIKGNINRHITEYQITSKTSTGKNNLTGINFNGQYTLSAETSTGNIEILFAK